MHVRELAQRIFDGPWQHAAGAVDACRTDSWPAFVRATAPRQPLFWGRLDHARCLERATRAPESPVAATALIVPVWACSTFEEQGVQWVAAHVEAASAAPLVIREAAPYLEDAEPRTEHLLECRVRRWSAATVVDGRYYAASVPLLLRSGGFAACGLTVVEVLEAETREGRALPRPTRNVPPFSTWVAPRVSVAPEIEVRLAALCHTASAHDA